MSAFPHRPTSAEVDSEYPPERVLRLCRYVAARVMGKPPKGKSGPRKHRHGGHDYDDAVGEAALSFYRRTKEYKSGQARIPDSYPFYHWLLFRIMTDVRQKFYRERRRLAGRTVTHLGAEARLILQQQPETAALVDRIAVSDALRCLSKLQAAAVRMYFFEHKSQLEIAAELGISQKNVSKRITRGVQNLRDFFAIEDDGGILED